MAFTVQTDGPVVPGANSFTSVGFFRSFLADRNIDTSAYTDQAVQGALVEATDHQDALYPWTGWPTTDDENRVGWPRSGAVVLDGSAYYRPGYVIPVNVIPLALQRATAWFALARLESGLPLAERRQRNSEVLKRKRIDVIEKEWEDPFAVDRFPAAERCLTGLWMDRGADGVRLVR